jgi:predicted SAM-dependent methyltransferase
MDEHQAGTAQPDAQEALAGPTEAPTGIRRLNWGCGEEPEPGWINSDIKDMPGIDIVADIRDGLPLQTSSIDYVVSIHALPEIPYDTLETALRELWRVLKPGGVLRLALPDLDKAIQAYLAGDSGYFLVPDEDARTIGGKLIVQMTWYGWSRSLFTHEFIEELCIRAGFSRVDTCSYMQTASEYPEIVELDSREKESLYVEAVK